MKRGPQSQFSYKPNQFVAGEEGCIQCLFIVPENRNPGIYWTEAMLSHCHLVSNHQTNYRHIFFIFDGLNYLTVCLTVFQGFQFAIYYFSRTTDDLWSSMTGVVSLKRNHRSGLLRVVDTYKFSSSCNYKVFSVLWWNFLINTARDAFKLSKYPLVKWLFTARRVITCFSHCSVASIPRTFRQTTGLLLYCIKVNYKISFFMYSLYYNSIPENE